MPRETKAKKRKTTNKPTEECKNRTNTQRLAPNDVVLNAIMAPDHNRQRTTVKNSDKDLRPENLRKNNSDTSPP